MINITKFEDDHLFIEEMRNQGVSANAETFKAFVTGMLYQIESNIEAHITGGLSAEEILKLDIEEFEKFGEAKGNNRTSFSLESLELPEELKTSGIEKSNELETRRLNEECKECGKKPIYVETEGDCKVYFCRKCGWSVTE